MRQIITNAEEVLAPFMERICHSHGAFVAGRAVGLVDVDPETNMATICASVWFEGYNGANMNIHVAANPEYPGRWMTREFLWYTFHYPFVECGVKRLTGLVASTNHLAQRFDEHLGFKLEATLKNAAPDGDMLVYVMFKEDCRFLNIRHVGPPMRRSN